MTTIDERLERIEHAVDKLTQGLEHNEARLVRVEQAVERFSFEFKTYQTIGERLERMATSMIAGAVISIVIGVVFLLLRDLG